MRNILIIIAVVVSTMAFGQSEILAERGHWQQSQYVNGDDTLSTYMFTYLAQDGATLAIMLHSQKIADEFSEVLRSGGTKDFKTFKVEGGKITRRDGYIQLSKRDIRRSIRFLTKNKIS